MALIYPIFIPEEGCPSKCIYCDQHKISGREGFDPEQAGSEIRQFILRNPGKEKQVAFYGGSFTALSRQRMEEIFGMVVPLIDEQTSLRISTHPLSIDKEVVSFCAENRVSVIELGIQSFADEVLLQSGRGYLGDQAVKACLDVLGQGIELGIQLMPGLPGSSRETDVSDLMTLLKLKPHYLRIYPLIVIRGTALAELYTAGSYVHLKMDEAIRICADYSEAAQRKGIKVIKVGLPSGISESEILGGPWHPAFGEFVKAELLIRQIVLDYQADQTIFISKQDRSLLLGHSRKYQTLLCERLRICSDKIVYL